MEIRVLNPAADMRRRFGPWTKESALREDRRALLAGEGLKSS
jgi:hypothetical protein